MKTGLMNTFNIKLHLNKGFSLIELLVVVAIIGIISAVGYPNIMKWYTKKQLRNDAHELFAVLKDAQQDSLLNKQLHRININSEGTIISVEINENPDCNQIINQDSYSTPVEKLTLKNSKLIVSGPQVFSPNGCCSNLDYTKEYKIIHKSDKNNGADYGIYKITTKKATCFMNLEKGN